MIAEVSSVSFSVVEVCKFRFDVLVVGIEPHNRGRMFHYRCVASGCLMPEYAVQSSRQIVSQFGH